MFELFWDWLFHLLPSQFQWVLLGLLVAVIILAAVLYYT
jgi:hypothetical protein